MMGLQKRLKILPLPRLLSFPFVVLSVIIVIISNNEVQGFSSVTRTAVTRDIALGKIHMTNIFSAPNPILLSNNPSFQEETCSASLVILHASTFSSCTQTNPKSKTKIMSSLFSSNSQTSKASNRIVLGLSIVLATMLSKCMKACASHVSTATSVQTVSPLLSAFQGIAIKSVQQIQLLIKNSNTLEKAIWTVSSMLLVKEIFLNLGSRKRQQKDPTSEWGRYADYPAARGRALGMLFLKLSPFILASSITKILSFSDISKSIRQKSGKCLSDGLLKLGPLYIKIGQILSCREKLLPPEWVTALERLQDRVPAKSGEDALELARSAFGSKEFMDDVLESFDDVPIAAASLGQVHLGVLKPNVTSVDSMPNSKNVKVAIKIQRARLRDIYDKDLALMKKIAKMGDKFSMDVGGAKQSWSDIFQDTEKILYREIDYQTEARNAIQFALDFGIGYDGTSITPTNPELPSASSWLRTPYIYENLSNEKILVQEYVPSIKINDFDALKNVNVTQPDRDFLAECLARSYLRQFCSNQFFSTDPHPGNLGVEVIKETGRPRLVFYDFGQACSLQKDQAEGILSVIEGIMDLDAPGCVQAFDQMGVLVKGADLDIVTRKVQQNFDTGKVKVKKRKSMNEGETYDLTTESNGMVSEIESSENQKKPLAQNAETVQDKDVMPYFTLPAEYAFVARALSQMDGVGKSLDPEFDFISASAPYIVEVKGVKTFVVDKVAKLEAEWIEKLGLDPEKIKGIKNVIQKRSFDE